MKGNDNRKILLLSDILEEMGVGAFGEAVLLNSTFITKITGEI